MCPKDLTYHYMPFISCCVLAINLSSHILHYSSVSFTICIFTNCLHGPLHPLPLRSHFPTLGADVQLYKYDEDNNSILYIILYQPKLDHKPSTTKYKTPKPFLPPLPQLPPSQYPLTTQQKMVELLRIRDDRRGFSGKPLKVKFIQQYCHQYRNA